MKNRVLVVGSGFMASEYLKVLSALECDVVIVGRGEEKITILRSIYPQFTYFAGGLDGFLKNSGEVPNYAINTTNIDQLKVTSCLLIEKGIKNILVEKPGDTSVEGLKEIQDSASENSSLVFIAYNRRFYASVLQLKNEVELDGGVKSVHFEFTEWLHTINPELFSEQALNRWMISNSSHVIDTAFALIGKPSVLNAIVSGQNIISWHPSGCLFTGSGLSEQGIPFTYHSNWKAPGRWAIEINTERRKFYLKPMEKLQVQLLGSVQIEDFSINDQLDQDFKPGLYLQTKTFLNCEFEKLVNLNEQLKMTEVYNKIGGYK
jgi:predicted dehydrogenase